MKTPEEMAEEYVNTNGSGNETYEHGLREGYIAGYQAAKLESMRPKTDIIGDALNSSFAHHAIALLGDVYKVTNSQEKPDGWISAKKRLPEIGLLCAWWTSSGWCENAVAARDIGDSTDWWNAYDYWTPLPNPPKDQA